MGPGFPLAPVAVVAAPTVRSNLLFGRPDATEAELWEALEVAQAADFVRAMHGGLDAPINQGGSNVSGGQRQRLSIARALVRRPNVYLFDDSFSALDMATDARLRVAMKPYTRDAAVIHVDFGYILGQVTGRASVTVSVSVSVTSVSICYNLPLRLH